MNIFSRIGYGLLGSIILIPLTSISTVHAAIPLEVNIFYPGGGYNISALQTFQQNVGVHFTASKWYQDWSQPFDSSVANSFQAAGYIPELTWQPQMSGVGISFADVTNGHFDDYLSSTATAIKATGYPIRINLAPEMNENWVSWGVGNAGNDNINEKAFWRYVVQKFRDEGVNNVEWIWTPNIQNGSEKYTYGELFPGDEYIDFLGLDGYNWGTTRTWSKWQSFSEVFSPSYSAISSVSHKNIQIMETASAENGGDKALWISQMFSTLKNQFPKIQGITWFNINKETDWRIDSTQSAKEAFSAAANGIVVSTTLSSQKTQTTPKPTLSVPTAPVPKNVQNTSVSAIVINPAVPTYPEVTSKKQHSQVLATVTAPSGAANSVFRTVSAALPFTQTSENQSTVWWTVLILALIALKINLPKKRVLQTVPGLYR